MPPGASLTASTRSQELLASLKAKADALGFDACRVTSADPPEDARERLATWLAEGAHGDMDWMADTASRRGDPRALMGGGKSLVLVGLNYGPKEDPRAALARKSCGAISVYARHRDYHDLIKGRLKELAAHMVAAAKPAAADVKVFVDTAPLMEKPLAERAGIGWQGKHTNLVSRTFGSWLFLGALLTDLDLEPDAPEEDRCGTCRACLDACPTNAFPAPYQLDARRCVSYLTIELKGPIPLALRPLIGNRIYGCDDCLAVCPWNKFAAAGREAKLAAREDLDAPPLADLAGLDDPAFRGRFSGSPIKRIGRPRFIRNVLVAMGNARDPALANVARRRLDDESPLVRGAAVWALAQMLSEKEFGDLAQARAGNERDPSAAREWLVAVRAAVR